jgi:hypothetical protein
MGDLLAWLGWCDVTLLKWSEIYPPLFEYALSWDFCIESLCRWHEGLWLFDRAVYYDWVTRAPEELRDYVQWQLDCLELRFDIPPPHLQSREGAQGTVELEYLGSSFGSANSDSVSRIEKLYSLFPFYAHYNAHAFWPLEWPMAYDPSLKQMTQEYQCLRFVVARNSTWTRLVETRFEIDTFHDFLSAWHRARQRALSVLEALSDRLEMLLAGTAPDLLATFSGASDVQEFEEALIQIPKPPKKTPDELKQKLKAATKWNSHMTAWLGAFVMTAVFFQQNGRLPSPVESNNSFEEDGARAAHLTLYNFRDAANDLESMQEAMRSLFEVTGDTFKTLNLEIKEEQVFERTLNVLEAWLEDRPSERVHNLNSFLTQKHEQKRREIVDRIHAALKPLEAQGMRFQYPTGIYVDFPLSYIPVMFEVSDPCNFMVERDAVLEVMEPLCDAVNFGCLIPTFEGDRFLPGGFRVSLSPPLPDDEDGHKVREAVLFNVQELPGGVWSLLPERPLREQPRLVIKATLHNLLLELQTIASQRERLEPLTLAPGRFTRQLFEKHRKHLLSQPLGVGVSFEHIEPLMAEEFAEQKDTPAYRMVNELIRTLKSWSQAQKKLELIEQEAASSEEHLSELDIVRETLWQYAQEFGTLDFDAAHAAISQLTVKND